VNLNPDRFTRLSDWARTLPPRPLPRTVTPIPGEFHLGYLRRLAGVNHLDFLELARALDTPGSVPPERTHQELQQDRLAAAAGQPLARIARLYWPDPGRYTRDPEAFRRRLRPACRRCTARRGQCEPIPCKLPDQATVCRRHRRWIGPTVRSLADQHDLRPFPEYLTSHRRHQQLGQRAYPHDLGAAFRRAVETTRWRIVQGGHWNPAQQRRLRHFAPELWPHVRTEASRFERADHLHDQH